MRYDLDGGAGAGLRLGLILLSTEETLEYEARAALAGRDVNLLHARIPSQSDITPAGLEEMAGRMTATAALLPQGLDAVAYACTSGATVIGPERVATLIRAAHPGVPVTDPMSAVLAALRALNARRIALVTPYIDTVAGPMREYMAAQGIETASAQSFGQSEDRTVARITEASTLSAVLRAGRAPGIEAVFVSCTNLRSFGIIAAAEAELGLPVVSSNSALLWHLLSRAGVSGSGPGRIFGCAAA